MPRQALNYRIRLARADDARPIAEMSRDNIEQGLGWRWTEARVLSCILHPAVNVVVAREGSALAGFGIMEYGGDEAHLLLFAVHRRHRREGVGAALVRWLEATALTAGIGLIRLEARADNPGARSFYRALGYREVGTIRGVLPGPGGRRLHREGSVGGRRPMNRGALGFEGTCAGMVVAPPPGPAVHEPGRARVRGRLPRDERRGGSPVNRDHGGAVFGANIVEGT